MTLLTPSGMFAPEEAGMILEQAQQQSALMTLGKVRQTRLAGATIPVITGKPQASFVAEGAIKPPSDATVTVKQLALKKIVAVTGLSQELLIQDSNNELSDEIKADCAEAIALAIDSAGFHGYSVPGATGTRDNPFGAYIDQTTNVQGISNATNNLYGDLMAANTLLIGNSTAQFPIRPNGWAFDQRLSALAYAAEDAQKRPLFINGVEMLAGKPIATSTTIYDNTTQNTFGYLGDWSGLVVGVSNQIPFKLDSSGTIAGVSALEHNITWMIMEIWVGMVMRDPQRFVRLVSENVS